MATIGELHRRSLVGTTGLGTLGVVTGSPVLLAAGALTLGVIAYASRELYVPVRSARRRLLVHGATVLGLLLALLTIRIIKIDAVFIVLMLGVQNRILLRASARDDVLLVAGAVVLVAAATVVTTGLGFLVVFVAIVPTIVLALWTSTMLASAEHHAAFHLRMRTRPCPRGAAGLALLALVLTGVGFGASMLLPRYRFSPMLAAGAFATLPGASNSMTLDFGGPDREDNTVILRVEPEAGRAADVEGLYARLYVLPDFDGREWKARDQGQFAARPIEGERLKASPKLRIAQSKLTKDGGSHVLAVLGREGPWAVEGPRIQFDAGGSVIATGASPREFEYISVVGLPLPLIAGQRHAGVMAVAELALPEGLDPRIAALARSLTEGKTTDAEKISAVVAHFSRGFRYSLDRVDTKGADPLSHFLFVEKAGHCELYAGALATLLRAAGVRARVAAGYYLGRWNSFGGYLGFRQSDAHAWVEAWVEGQGWRWIDATPEGERRRKDESAWSSLRDGWEALSALWFNGVVDYDAKRQERAYERLGQSLARWWRGERTPDPSASPTAPGAFSGSLRPLLGGAALLLGLFFLAWPYRLTRARVGMALRRALAADADATLPLGRLLAGYSGDKAKARALVAAYEQLRFGRGRIDQRSLRSLMDGIRSLPRGEVPPPQT